MNDNISIGDLVYCPIRGFGIIVDYIPPYDENSGDGFFATDGEHIYTISWCKDNHPTYLIQSKVCELKEQLEAYKKYEL